MIDAVGRMTSESSVPNFRNLLIESRRVGSSIAVFQDTGMDLMDKIVSHFEEYDRHITNLSEGKMTFEMFIAERDLILGHIERRLGDLEDAVQMRTEQVEVAVYAHRDIIREQRPMSANVSSISKPSWKSTAFAWLSFARASEKENWVDYMQKANRCVVSLLRSQYELGVVEATIDRLRNRIKEHGRSMDYEIALEHDGEDLDGMWKDKLEMRLYEGRREIELWRTRRYREKERVWTETIVFDESFRRE